jgi:hypothetical protein
MILFQWFIYFQLSESSQSYVVNQMSSSYGFQISGPTSYVMTYIHPPGNYVQQITNSPNEQVYYIHRSEV